MSINSRTSKSRFLAAVLGIGLVVILIAGCASGAAPAAPSTSKPAAEAPKPTAPQAAASKSASEPATPGRGVTKDSIKIGAYLGLTGAASATSQDMKIGSTSYVNYINDQGGVSGRKIDFTIEDDQYTPSKTLAIVKKMVESDNIFALLNPLGASTTQAVLPYIGEQKVPLFSPQTAIMQLIKPFQKYSFATLLPYYFQGRLLGEYLANDLKLTKIAVIYQNDSYGSDVRDGLSEQLKKYNVSLVAGEAVENNTTDFSSVVLKIKQADPQAVVIVQMLTGVPRILKEAQRIGWKPLFAGPAPTTDTNLIRLSEGAAEGYVGVSPLQLVDSPDKAVQEYRDIVKKYYPDHNPSPTSLHSFVSAKIFAEALKRTGQDPTPDKLVDSLEAMKDYDTGLMPPISFSKDDHLGSYAASMAKVQGGKLVRVTDWKSLK